MIYIQTNENKNNFQHLSECVIKVNTPNESSPYQLSINNSTFVMVITNSKDILYFGEGS